MPCLEALEPRYCPANAWVWDGGAAGGPSLPWSNPNGGNWTLNGGPTVQGQFPGRVAGDLVYFTDPTKGPCTMDVANINSLGTLEFTGWSDTLTVNSSNLVVTGTTGDFQLVDASTISLAANVGLWLIDLGSNAQTPTAWTGGAITGGANTNFAVTGTTLFTGLPGDPGAPAGLGTNMVIQKSVQTQKPGLVVVNYMVINLALTGANNYIDVGNGGTLGFYQNIAAAGQQNTVGGISFGLAHKGNLAVQVESGGTLTRSDVPAPGVPDQVSIAGAVYNLGGTTNVLSGSMLNITGTDANNVSYWQKTGANGQLQVDNGSNINAAGTYQIDIGLVQLTAPGGGSADELDGAGLNFGNANNTKLTVVDSLAGTPGDVKVVGPVTLAANTTTTLNFNGSNNTADVFDVRNGALTLNGTLKLLSNDGRTLPTAPLTFFDDIAGAADILGDFSSITNNINRNIDTGQIVVLDPTEWDYQVTVQ
jgi:hypothetical protein